MAQWAVKVIVMVGSCRGCLCSTAVTSPELSVIIVTICRGDTEEEGSK